MERVIDQPDTGRATADALGDTALEFAALLREHQSMVFSLAYHYLHDRTAAEDVAQEVFLQLHRSLSKLKSSEHVLFWLRRVTVNRSIDAARHRKSRPELSLDEVHEPSQSEASDDPLLSNRLRRLVASLPEKSRAIVLLRFQEEMDLDEISQVLGLNINTVKSQLQRALKLLREKLSKVV